MEHVTFKSPDGSTVKVPLDKLVLNEHTCSIKGTSYLIKAMGSLETDPYQATFIAETTETNFYKHKKNYPVAHVTTTSSD